MDLAESSIEAPSWRRRAMRWVVALLVAGFVAGAAGWLRQWAGQPAPAHRQVARIAILPDTPPPPPPPREEKPPPPRDEPRPMPQAEAPKPAEAERPANEPLKMEGEAGTGPSAFAAGPVRNDYAGGAPNTGASAAASAIDRAQERLYANTARQLLRDAIERHLKPDATQATAEFTLWVERDGAIRRYELQPSGDARIDGDLDAALEQTQRSLRLPPPPAATQAMRFRLTVRPQG